MQKVRKENEMEVQDLDLVMVMLLARRAGIS
jgi:hypothetical protein